MRKKEKEETPSKFKLAGVQLKPQGKRSKSKTPVQKTVRKDPSAKQVTLKEEKVEKVILVQFFLKVKLQKLISMLK